MALVFLIPPETRLGRLRDPLLLLFCFAVYAVAPMASFGWLLIAMGVVQCVRTPAIRLWNMAAFVTLLFYDQSPVGGTRVGSAPRRISKR